MVHFVPLSVHRHRDHQRKSLCTKSEIRRVPHKRTFVHFFDRTVCFDLYQSVIRYDQIITRVRSIIRRGHFVCHTETYKYP